MRKCINCVYFLNCKKADENITNCEEFKTRNELIERWN